MGADTICPKCGSSSVRFLARINGWLCDACSNDWTPEEESAAADQSPPSGASAFISYGHADGTDFANLLKTALEERGIAPVWLDSEMIDVGDDWALRINDGIEAADAVLAVMTAHSLRPGGVCWNEIAFALERGTRVVPVRISDDRALRVNFLLAGLSWADFTQSGFDEAATRLVAGLSGDRSALQRVGAIGGAVPLSFAVEIGQLTECFSGRDWLDRQIDDWLERDASPVFVIEGEPGIGKSAIAAHLSQREDVVAVHFCSKRNTPTLDPREFVSGVVTLLSQRLTAFEDELIPRRPDIPREDAATAFRQLVVEPARTMEAPESPQLLVIDALDEAVLRDGESIIDILSQAEALPSWLRIVATTRPESVVTSRLKACSTVRLAADSKENLADVDAFLRTRFAESSLPEPQAKEASEIVSVRAAGNFLYARLAAEAVLATDLSAAELSALPPGLDAFYSLAFSRLFADHEAYLDEVVPILGPLSVAFAPIPFAVLKASSGLDASRLNQRLLRMRSYLKVEGVGTEARYALFHRSLSDWLRSMDCAGPYWCDPHNGHSAMVTALESSPRSTRFAVRWLPEHLAGLDRWDALASLLGDSDFLTALQSVDEYAPRRLWAKVHANSAIRAEAVYGPLIGQLDATQGRTLNVIGVLLHELGAAEPADRALARSADVARELGDQALLHAALGNRALVLRDRLDLSGAIQLLKEQEQMCRESRDDTGLSASLGNQAVIALSQRDYEAANTLLQEQESICSGSKDQAGMAECLGNQALACAAQGMHDAAMELHKREQRYCEERGDLAGLGRSLGNQALLHRSLGDLAEAAVLLRKQEEICRELGDRASLAACLGNQVLLVPPGDSDFALELLEKQERIFAETHNRSGLTTVLSRRALIFQRRGQLDAAMALHRERENLCRELGDLDGVQRALGHQALILQTRGDLAGAMELHKQEELLCLQTGHELDLSVCLGNQALILVEQGDLPRALELRKQEQAIAEKFGDKAGIASSIGGQAAVLRESGDLIGSLALHREEESLYHELQDEEGLVASWCGQAKTLVARGDLDAAVALLEARESVCRGLDDPVELGEWLYVWARTLALQGLPEKAAPMARESLALSESIGNAGDAKVRRGLLTELEGSVDKS